MSTSANCPVRWPAASVCSGHGVCLDAGGGVGVCKCDAGWSSRSDFVVDSNDCSFHEGVIDAFWIGNMVLSVAFIAYSARRCLIVWERHASLSNQAMRESIMMLVMWLACLLASTVRAFSGQTVSNSWLMTILLTLPLILFYAGALYPVDRIFRMLPMAATNAASRRELRRLRTLGRRTAWTVMGLGCLSFILGTVPVVIAGASVQDACLILIFAAILSLVLVLAVLAVVVATRVRTAIKAPGPGEDGPAGAERRNAAARIDLTLKRTAALCIMFAMSGTCGCAWPWYRYHCAYIIPWVIVVALPLTTALLHQANTKVAPGGAAIATATVVVSPTAALAGAAAAAAAAVGGTAAPAATMASAASLRYIAVDN